MNDSLVFDIGMNNGDDSAYYLWLGFRVVGVDASPVLAETCRQRFSAEISAGNMIVVNAGVAACPGEFEFFSI
jgi:hypothetical protein